MAQILRTRDLLEDTGAQFYPYNARWSFDMDKSLLGIAQDCFRNNREGRMDWEEVMWRFNDGLSNPARVQTADGCRIRYWQLTFWDCTADEEELATVF
ncbi:hypothetical protein RUND412_000935 [Rhizina undulata]